MPFSCAKHSAMLYDRGGKTPIGSLGPLTRVQWSRDRDDISSAHVYIEQPNVECAGTLGLVEAGRCELVIFRNDDRIWEGPVTRIGFSGSTVEIEARDVVHYVYRTIMRNEYDNRYPNNGSVLDRMERVFTQELARKEALDPPINVLPYLRILRSTDPENPDAGTTARTLKYEMTVFEHLDAMAARGGIDYTTVGRSILLFDVHNPIGQTPPLTRNDFLGDVVISQYGMELATYAAITDGKGRWADVGGTDPYYGLVEILDTAFEEGVDNDLMDEEDEEKEPVTIGEMRSQAQRILSGRNPSPTNVRVPDGSSLNPNGNISLVDLVPGVWMPLWAEVPGRRLTQMQKLDRVEVEESAEVDEEVRVTLSPAPGHGVFVEEPGDDE